MKWLLIIVTFYSPHAGIKVQELETYGEKDCQRMQERFADRWDLVTDPSFHYSMRCELRSTDAPS